MQPTRKIIRKTLKATHKAWDQTIGRVLVLTLVGLIRIYQKTLSVWRGPVCRYYPSCSHYGVGALQIHGATKGILLTTGRVLRCHPWSAGGIDLVPSRGNWTYVETEVIEDSTKLNRQVA
jgi:putative membrane protein insertion efficiency factor